MEETKTQTQSSDPVLKKLASLQDKIQQLDQEDKEFMTALQEKKKAVIDKKLEE